jgi:hypothetical protein
LSTALIKKLLSVQAWYGYMIQDDDNDPIIIVYSLTTNILSIWQWNQVVQQFSTDSSSLPTSSPTLPTTRPVASLPQTSPTFRRAIKVNISNYPKLKDKNQWCTFHRQLLSTAASYDTLKVVDPKYVPSLEDRDSFRSKQRFMYNVFSNIILTTKCKNCICDECISMDAQKVYARLLEAYHDPLSINLSATKLCQELTLMKLDDKWRKSYESFLHFWTAKIQDLKGY